MSTKSVARAGSATVADRCGTPGCPIRDGLFWRGTELSVMQMPFRTGTTGGHARIAGNVACSGPRLL